MRLNKEQKAFAKLLKQHGLTLESGGKHFLVRKNGKTVSSLSTTMSGVNGYREAIRILCRNGLLPNEARREII